MISRNSFVFPAKFEQFSTDGVMKSSDGMCSPFVSKNISAKLVYAFWELENFLMRTWLHIIESFLKESRKGLKSMLMFRCFQLLS